MQEKFDLKSFVQKIDRLEGVEGYNVVVIQNGQVKGRYDWKPVERRQVYSITKSITCAAVGSAINEGLFSIEDRVVDLFPDELPEEPSENLKAMKVKHLLTMTMGFASPMLMGFQRKELEKTELDWVRYVLSQKVENKPGVRFLYNNAGPYLLSVLLQRRSGLSWTEYLTPRLFEPLGIESVGSIYKCPKGYEFGAYGLQLNVDELVKIAQLYMQKGIWMGKQVIPYGWIERATAYQTYGESDDVDNELASSYGYLLWRGPCGKWFYFFGAYEQTCIMIPEANAVIVFVGHSNGARVSDAAKPALETKPVRHLLVRELVYQLTENGLDVLK